MIPTKIKFLLRQTSYYKLLTWLILFTITLSAAFIIIFLHNKAGILDVATNQLVQERIYLSEAASIDTRVISRMKVDTQIQQEFDYVKNKVENTFNSSPLTSLKGKKIDDFKKDVKNYLDAIQKEITLVEYEKFESAQNIQKNEVKFHEIMVRDSSIAVTSELSSQSRHLKLLGNLGIVLTAIIAAILIGMLFGHINVVLRDIAIKETEQQTLKESETRFRSLIQNSSDVILIVDSLGMVRYASPSVHQLIGLSPEVIYNSNFRALFGKEGYQGLSNLLENCLKNPTENHALDIASQGGYYKVIANNMLDNATVKGIVINLRDITSRKASEKELQEQEKFLSNIFTSIQDGLMVTDNNFTVLRVNPTTEKLYKNSFPLVGKKCYEIFLNRNTPCETCYCKVTLKTGQQSHAMIKREIEKGKFSYFEFYSFPLIDINTKEITGIIHYSRDITERHHLEKEMARYEGLNLIGEIAASIAHEIRNPMTTVRGFLQLFSAKQGVFEEEYLSIMINELDRANSIITEFLSLAKNRALEIKTQNLNSVIEKLAPLITADALSSEKIVKLDLQVIPDINFDEKEIRQLILNLVRNGLEAMNEKGTLTIKTYAQNEHVILNVKDEGGGIPQDVLEKLGTPFLTTKEKGTGLGLSVCYGIAAKHNAEIVVDTSDKGTTFYVKFPNNC